MENIKILDNPLLNEVKGFKSNGVACEIKYKNRLDLGLIFSEKEAITFAKYTTNKVQSSHITVCKAHLKDNIAQAIIVNSGNANACTGEKGIEDAFNTTDYLAKKLGIKKENVLPCSTGVIGVPLPMDKIYKGIDQLVLDISKENDNNFTKAIMTTDTVPKIFGVKVKIEDKEYSIVGTAKGSGMIHPNMATLLAYIITDVNIDKKLLKEAFDDSVEKSFNSITVDGDTSTNDTVIIMSNGAIANKKISRKNEDYKNFCLALNTVMTNLAKMIAKDGEGATKFIEINILNAKNKKDAKEIGMSIAKSSLVKTAFFGEDANWGRIICAAGYSKADFDYKKAKLSIEDMVLFENGRNKEFSEEKAKEILSKKEIRIFLDLNNGKSCWTVWTCDLSFDYIKINASYRT
ncbi:MAG TPA: bifunctional glutamate N-acetyltransferase/amino-acid acetyltransferase ArgJ [Spirochaetota bacterium]|mgnify:CR=1 FL=1|nr:bifunctional glutamate N-acetyltransferase/amino-acid acetyltransferase ArgJ [Spirochaetota bacterium]HOL57572.1 bifunctional glutamate N-acetyltransferase/amino-acid acetyltransferase ArgJ [Spirochaetota bacterium]HPP05140.1 bifunctional glutamate N-acetyltransferase/amino-acid acetyltransferase ArgJ [Spirochaetota bacterium]